MYFYFYDKFTQDPKFEATLTKIETRLIDLGINGRVEKLSMFKNAQELIEDAIKKGAHTVVAVGDDTTFASVVNIVATHDVTLGYIPLVSGSRFAEVLGIPEAEEACNVLSKRLCETVDLGCCNDSYFLGSMSVPEPSKLKLRCDDKYSIQTTEETTILRILNWGDILGGESVRFSRVTDGKIDVVISPAVSSGLLKRRSAKQSLESVFPVESIHISSTTEDTVHLTADNVLQFNTPCEVEVRPEMQKVIVGKDRQLLDSTEPEEL